MSAPLIAGSGFEDGFASLDVPPLRVIVNDASGAPPVAVSVRRKPCLAITAQPKKSKGISSSWTKWATALERFIEGRGPCPVASPTKHYEPVAIIWSELTPDLLHAFERVAEALTWPRVLEEKGAERLVGLNQKYKRWTRGRESADSVIAAAESFVDFVEAAPRPSPPEPPPDSVREDIDAPALMEAVRRVIDRAPANVRGRLEEEAITEALLGDFEPTDSLDTRARRSVWRVEKRVRREIRRMTGKTFPRNDSFESEPFEG